MDLANESTEPFKGNAAGARWPLMSSYCPIIQMQSEAASFNRSSCKPKVAWAGRDTKKDEAN